MYFLNKKRFTSQNIAWHEFPVGEFTNKGLNGTKMKKKKVIRSPYSPPVKDFLFITAALCREFTVKSF